MFDPVSLEVNAARRREILTQTMREGRRSERGGRRPRLGSLAALVRGRLAAIVPDSGRDAARPGRAHLAGPVGRRVVSGHPRRTANAAPTVRGR